MNKLIIASNYVTRDELRCAYKDITNVRIEKVSTIEEFKKEVFGYEYQCYEIHGSFKEEKDLDDLLNCLQWSAMPCQDPSKWIPEHIWYLKKIGSFDIEPKEYTGEKPVATPLIKNHDKLLKIHLFNDSLEKEEYISSNLSGEELNSVRSKSYVLIKSDSKYGNYRCYYISKETHFNYNTFEEIRVITPSKITKKGSYILDFNKELLKLDKVVIKSIRSNHPLIKYFKYDHLPERLQEISKQFHDVAIDMDSRDLDDDEVTVGLRKLLEAKDCFVRGGV